MRVMVCLALVDTGFIKYTDKISLLISVNGFGTVCHF